MSLSDEEVGIAPPAPPAQTSLSDADVGLGPATAASINPKLIANVAALDARRSDTFFQSIRNHVEPVLSAFGQGFREGWGPDRLGMSPEDTKWLSEKGIYAPAGATKYDNPFQAMNELLGETIWSAGQIVGRGLPATYRGVQAALVERGVNRDVVSIPDAFMGTPHPTGIPKTLPEVPRTSIGELAAGERPATMRDLAQARELKVTGPHRSARRPAARRGRRAGHPADGRLSRLANPVHRIQREGATGEEPTGNPWQDRFDKFVGKLNTRRGRAEPDPRRRAENDGFQGARRRRPARRMSRASRGGGRRARHRGPARHRARDEERCAGPHRHAVMLQATENVRDAAREVKADLSRRT
jgi:hypothetical protein